MKVSSKVRITGPLVDCVGGFAARLADQGYTHWSRSSHVRLVADLSRWLERRGLEVQQLSPQLMDQFLAKRRRTYTVLVSKRAVAPLLGYLRSIGAVALWEPVAPSQCELLRRYEDYLAEQLGVTGRTRKHRLQVAHAFLSGRNASELTPAEVTRFIAGYAGRPPSFALWLTALRSLLRFLFLVGETPVQLAHAVPSAPPWRQASLSKGLEPAEVAAVLGTCDRRTTLGCRDYAALVLMVRLGLRCGEVAALTLDDMDWNAGEIVVRGKGGTLARLPLPVDVGQALVSYLRRRRRGVDSRAVFLKSRAPCGAGSSGMINGIATRALRAAGISRGAAHRLRHTAATHMLRCGASLTEIAQVLRHRHIDTTAIYAKVDHRQLRSLAQPWPDRHLDALGHDELRALAPCWPGGAA